MIDVNVQVLGLDSLTRALQQTPGELRRAGRNVLNDLGREAQKGIRDGMSQSLTIRRPAFVNRSVYFPQGDRATVDKLMARVSMNPDRGDVLGQHDVTGTGQKVPASGRRVAVPVRDLRTDRGAVPRAQAFSSFKPFVTQGGAVSTLRKKGDRLVARGGKTLRAQVVGRRGTFFATLRRSGLEALFQRQRGEPTPRLLYVLMPRVTLPRRVDFHRWAQQAVDRALPALIDRELGNALRRIAEGR